MTETVGEPQATGPTGEPDFWAWWASDGADACASAIAEGDVDRVVDELGRRVEQVAVGLAWELAPGHTSQHLLVVSPEGRPELRAAARRWLLGAPAPTTTWQFADSRQPVLDLEGTSVSVADGDIAFAEVRVSVARVGHHLDVVVHHPALAGLPQEAATAVALIVLDAALGEEAVETWVGSVAWTGGTPADAVTLGVLVDVVVDLRADLVDADGEPSWVMLHASDGAGAPVVCAAQVPLCATYAPHLDEHVAVVVPFAGTTAEGLPTPSSLDALRGLEDHLVERLGAAGRLVAHETSTGERVLHFYVESTMPAVGVLAAAVEGWADGEVTVHAAPDPSWSGVAHLRT